MKARFATAAVLVGTLVGGSAWAQPEMRPGLWEQSITVKSQSGEVEQAMREMQQQMANLPPEQRRMMEEMMAAQGMSFDASGQTIRVCVTPEQAARFEFEQDDECTQQVVQRSGKTVKLTFQCAGDPPTSGEGEFTFSSPTAYKGRAVVNTTTDGRPEQLTMEQSGKWLSSDCGNMRPN